MSVGVRLCAMQVFVGGDLISWWSCSKMSAFYITALPI